MTGIQLRRPSSRTTTRPATVRWRIGPRLRKVLLLLHIAAAGAWLGIDIVLGLLVLAAFTPGDDLGAAAALTSIGYFATWPLAAVGLLCLATGVLLGLGTKYGLVRYWWVAIKLVLNVVLVTLVIAALGPGIHELTAGARASLAAGRPLPVLTDLAFPPIVSTAAVLFATTLSVFKPWGRLRRAAR
ncbi:hypothetical protein C1I95_31315 [Micromonospora craterilacus]|uniref:DUF2269 domain-containing protein n=1 Tax=Micromonospora craterilacus TaxID=1655439 RepID=A0A2W2E182_9ACTN|nr:hypothetical protein [Micromonospora craterilacus]PZG07250.1 hypothetical protein C1I95_31315 [Micromonospora craterilacus]